MKPLVSNIFFLFAFLFSNGQSINQDAKKFILNFYKTRSPGSYFIYAKGINTYEQKEIIKAIQKRDTLKNWERVNNKILFIDSLILTAEEKQLLIAKIKNQIDTSLWNGIDIPNSISILRDTITSIFKDKERGWNYYRSAYGNNINSFTIPIFFRNNTLCAFYYDYSCGSLCGEGVLAIYRKQKGEWIRWFTIYEWVS